MKKILILMMAFLTLPTSGYAQEPTCCPNVDAVKKIIDEGLLNLNNEIIQYTLENAAKKKTSVNVQTNLPFLHRNIFQHNDGKLCSYRINSTTGPLIYTIPSYPCPKK